jgi:hypothetical protein
MWYINSPAAAAKMLAFYNNTQGFTFPAGQSSNGWVPDTGWLSNFGWQQAWGIANLSSISSQMSYICMYV